MSTKSGTNQFHGQGDYYSGALGTTNVAANAASGLKPGMGANGDTFGVLTLAGTGSVFDPRQVVMNLRLRF